MESFLIIKREIAPDGMSEQTLGGEPNSMIDVTFERMEKGLHASIIGHAPWTIHALYEAKLSQAPSKGECCILAASVGVKD